MSSGPSPGNSAFLEETTVQPLDATRHGDATREIEAFLRSRIVGQDATVDAVLELYQIFLVGMSAPDRPVGNLLFLGRPDPARLMSSRCSPKRSSGIPTPSSKWIAQNFRNITKSPS